MRINCEWADVELAGKIVAASLSDAFACRAGEVSRRARS